MASNSQRRALDAHRRRLAERGLGRFEVRGLDTDKALIRGLARLLAANDAAAGALRADLVRRIDRDADAACRRHPGRTSPLAAGGSGYRPIPRGDAGARRRTGERHPPRGAFCSIRTS